VNTTKTVIPTVVLGAISTTHPLKKQGTNHSLQLACFWTWKRKLTIALLDIANFITIKISLPQSISLKVKPTLLMDLEVAG
jgi:hypothetical protein